MPSKMITMRDNHDNNMLTPYYHLFLSFSMAPRISYASITPPHRLQFFHIIWINFFSPQLSIKRGYDLMHSKRNWWSFQTSFFASKNPFKWRICHAPVIRRTIVCATDHHSTREFVFSLVARKRSSLQIIIHFIYSCGTFNIYEIRQKSIDTFKTHSDYKTLHGEAEAGIPGTS